VLAVVASVAAVPAVSAVPNAKATCTITGTSGDDILRGTPGDDVICGLGGDDQIFGRGGDDVLRGGPGFDVLRGGDGDDLFHGGAGGGRLVDAGSDPRDEVVLTVELLWRRGIGATDSEPGVRLYSIDVAEGQCYTPLPSQSFDWSRDTALDLLTYTPSECVPDDRFKTASATVYNNGLGVEMFDFNVVLAQGVTPSPYCTSFNKTYISGCTRLGGIRLQVNFRV